MSTTNSKLPKAATIVGLRTCPIAAQLKASAQRILSHQSGVSANESLSSISRLFPTQFTGKSFRCLVTLLQLVLGNIFIFRSLKKSSSSSCSSQILPTSIVTHQMRRDLVPVLARAWANAANAKLHFVRVAPLAYDDQLPSSQK